MYKDLKILGIIPARGGSKGIPHKNIVDLCGKPLIGYSIDAGLQSRYIDHVMVSTDDEEIARVAAACGAEVPFMRPDELATDTATTLDVILHALAELKRRGMDFDLLVLLQPTQPLRTAEDVDRAIEHCVENGCLPLVSVSEVDDHPLLIRTIKDGRLQKMLDASSTCRRQDMPAFYRVNGCIYINRVDEIDEHTSFNDNILPFVMEKSHSVDIDEPRDLELAGYYLKGKK